MSKSRSSIDKNAWVLVVYFDFTRAGRQIEEESIVPAHWLSNNEKKLWWPDGKIISNKISLIPSCDGWSSYEVKKVKFSGNQFDVKFLFILAMISNYLTSMQHSLKNLGYLGLYTPISIRLKNLCLF